VLLVAFFSLIRHFEPANFYRKAYELAMDCSVLGFGIFMTLIASAEVRQVLQESTLGTGAIIGVVDFVLVTVSILLKRGHIGFRESLYSTLMASLICGINLGLVTSVNKPGHTGEIVTLGSLPIIIGVTLLLTLRRTSAAQKVPAENEAAQ